MSSAVSVNMSLRFIGDFTNVAQNFAATNAFVSAVIPANAVVNRTVVAAATATDYTVRILSPETMTLSTGAWVYAKVLTQVVSGTTNYVKFASVAAGTYNQRLYAGESFLCRWNGADLIFNCVGTVAVVQIMIIGA